MFSSIDKDTCGTDLIKVASVEQNLISVCGTILVYDYGSNDLATCVTQACAAGANVINYNKALTHCHARYCPNLNDLKTQTEPSGCDIYIHDVLRKLYIQY